MDGGPFGEEDAGRAGLAIDAVGIDDGGVDGGALDDGPLRGDVAAREGHGGSQPTRSGQFGGHDDRVGIDAILLAEDFAKSFAARRLLPPVEDFIDGEAGDGPARGVEQPHAAEVEHNLRHAAGEEDAHGHMPHRAVRQRIDETLDWWEASPRRERLRQVLRDKDGVDPDTVIMSPELARSRGLTSTVTFPRGNIAPEGSVIKSTAIDPSVVDADGVYRKTGPARVFTTEKAAIAAIKGHGDNAIRAGDILVLICRGPMGSGMEETYQITSALKHVPWGKHVAVITDARFSGVSTGACIGHVGPEALAGGPIGKVRDGDRIRIVVDRINLVGSLDLVGEGDHEFGVEEGTRVIRERSPRPDLAADPGLPADTRLWAALQAVSGGTWGGCVYDVDAIVAALERGRVDSACRAVSS